VTVPYLYVRQTQGGDTTDNNGIRGYHAGAEVAILRGKGRAAACDQALRHHSDGRRGKRTWIRPGACGIRLISTFDREAGCVNVNLGCLYNEYGLQSNRDAYRPDIWYAGLSGQLRVREKLWLVGETAVGRNPDVTSDTPPAYILGGFIYEITKNIDLDVGYKHGLNKPAMDYSISGAITVGF